MSSKLGVEMTIKGTNIVGTLIGKGFAEKDGKVEEKYILKIDTKRTLIQDLVPFLGEILVDPAKILR